MKIYHTIKHLTSGQIYYQIKNRFSKPERHRILGQLKTKEISLIQFPQKPKSYFYTEEKHTFKFLNVLHVFEKHNIFWDYTGHGMLWAYNLNYFDWLNQDGLEMDSGLELLVDYYKGLNKNRVGLQPYPTSLRIVNVSKFVVTHRIKDDWIFKEVLSDLHLLSRNLEFHLRGNHLLENAISMYIGGILINENRFITKSKKLLIEQLSEQILNDGMHYERSPMYHLIILERLLDAYNFCLSVNDDLGSLLEKYLLKMLSLANNWAELKRFPMMQDSAYFIAIPHNQLFEFGKLLLKEKYPLYNSNYDSSGYRQLAQNGFKLIANVGNIGPSYQPGHAHADELNFELFYNGQPIIVDTGVSTYNKNKRRQLERSTISHNCLSVNEQNSSDVWSAFRVGRRATVTLNEDQNSFKASHNGFRNMIVSREYMSENSNLYIIDELFMKNKNNNKIAVGRIHFHPSLSVKMTIPGSYTIGENFLSIKFESKTELIQNTSTKTYKYAEGYNNLVDANFIEYPCDKFVKITIMKV